MAQDKENRQGAGEPNGGPFPPRPGRVPTDDEKDIAKGQETKERNRAKREIQAISEGFPIEMMRQGVRGEPTRRQIHAAVSAIKERFKKR